MAYPNTFGSQTTATGAQLDTCLDLAGELGVIPCTATGSDVILAAQMANISPDVLAYRQGLKIQFVVAATNTGPVTLQLGALTALNCYKDSPAGPVALGAGDFFLGNTCTATYDSALNGGVGGWHVTVAQGGAGTGTVTSISAGTGITVSPSPITSTGSVALAAAANLTIKANVSGGTAAPADNTLTNILDQIIGTAAGTLITRGASAWAALAPANAESLLYTDPATNAVAWGLSKDLAVAATGSAIGDAYQLKAMVTQVTSTPASTGVKLAVNIGLYVVINFGGATLNVYPADGSMAINAFGVGVADTIANQHVTIYAVISATQAYTIAKF